MCFVLHCVPSSSSTIEALNNRIVKGLSIGFGYTLEKNARHVMSTRRELYRMRSIHHYQSDNSIK